MAQVCSERLQQIARLVQDTKQEEGDTWSFMWLIRQQYFVFKWMPAYNDELYVIYVITSDFCCQLIFYASERPTMCQIKITSKYWSRFFLQCICVMLHYVWIWLMRTCKLNFCRFRCHYIQVYFKPVVGRILGLQKMKWWTFAWFLALKLVVNSWILQLLLSLALRMLRKEFAKYFYAHNLHQQQFQAGNKL